MIPSTVKKKRYFYTDLGEIYGKWKKEYQLKKISQRLNKGRHHNKAWDGKTEREYDSQHQK